MPKIMLNSVEYTGGGGDSGMELTYDEYLALPEKEKNNGTTYYVKDINGVGNDEFQPIIYSEEEREIGVWTDGKPLYKCTLAYEKSDISRGNNTITHGISNFSMLAWSEGLVIYIDGTCVTLPAAGVNNDWSARAYDFYTTAFTLTIGNGMYNNLKTSGDAVFITVYYTKTTDTPGSGTWTPQGVPAVHYDGNEKVVGTWFGETLYEKSYQLTGIKGDNVIVDATLTSSAIRPIHIHSSFYITGGAYQEVSFAHELTNGQFIRVGVNASQGLFCDIDGYNTSHFGTDGANVYITIQYIKIITL